MKKVLFYITAVSVWDGLEKVVRRSHNEETLMKQYNEMKARGLDVKFTTIKPKLPKQSLRVGVLSYTDEVEEVA